MPDLSPDLLMSVWSGNPPRLLPGVMIAAPAPIFASFGELMAVMIALSAIVALLVLPCLLVVVTPAKTSVGNVDLLTVDDGSTVDDVDLISGGRVLQRTDQN